MRFEVFSQTQQAFQQIGIQKSTLDVALLSRAIASASVSLRVLQSI